MKAIALASYSDGIGHAYQASAESRQIGACDVRQPLVTCVGDDAEQFLDAVAPDRRNNPELGTMGADRVDHRSLLADEQVPCAMKHQATLLLWSLRRHKPHVGSGDRFTDSFRVSGIVLLPFDIRLYVSRRHQTHGVSTCLELARPMV
jgi:hypothetical protein